MTWWLIQTFQANRTVIRIRVSNQISGQRFPWKPVLVRLRFFCLGNQTVPTDQVGILKVRRASGDLVRVSALKFESGDDLTQSGLRKRIWQRAAKLRSESKVFPDDGGMGTL